MATLEQTSLTDSERRVLAHFVELLKQELGEDLRSVWLYGSRARGEQPGEDSDVDLLVVADGVDYPGSKKVHDLLYRAALDNGEAPEWFSARPYTPERLAQRREIRSFFIQEVDRDKIVLYGEP
jgi:predicted nucleotidyltransferase